MATKTAKPIAKKKSSKPTNAEVVAEYMDKLAHPLKAEMKAVRKIIKDCDKSIKERIKWNAPSYYTSADMVTFTHRSPEYVHLIFHHPAIVKIKSPLLEGDYKDRRMTYFRSMKEVTANKKELQCIIKELVQLIA